LVYTPIAEWCFLHRISKTKICENPNNRFSEAPDSYRRHTTGVVVKSVGSYKFHTGGDRLPNFYGLPPPPFCPLPLYERIPKRSRVSPKQGTAAAEGIWLTVPSSTLHNGLSVEVIKGQSWNYSRFLILHTQKTTFQKPDNISKII